MAEAYVEFLEQLETLLGNKFTQFQQYEIARLVDELMTVTKGAYEDGYEEGYRDGKDESRDESYERGYDIGHAEGYDEGFDEGKRQETEIF